MHREVCESVFYRDYQDNPQGHLVENPQHRAEIMCYLFNR